jgi:pyruvate dehydrogenase E1 component alpha subunit
MAEAAKFVIEHVGFLDPLGKPLKDLPSDLDLEALVDCYRAMVRLRRFDAKAVALQRTGRLGTYAVSLGQEAIPIGVASVMRAEDVLIPSYRDGGALAWRGVGLHELLLYWGGDERGSDFAKSRQDFPFSIPVASHCLHAVGVAYAIKLRREPKVAVCMIGDGATSNGAFYEAINCAGVWNVPAVFVISNNQWAISVPRSAQTAAETLAQKTIAAGMPGVQVDGNDLIAVRHATSEAIERARNGGGPSLIEALTYRLSDHTTADDASRYRTAEHVEAARTKEPVTRLRAFLTTSDHWNDRKEQDLIEIIDGEIDEAVDRYLAMPVEPPTAMFDHLHAELPPTLKRQREAVVSDISDGSSDG